VDTTHPFTTALLAVHVYVYPLRRGGSRAKVLRGCSLDDGQTHLERRRVLNIDPPPKEKKPV